MYRIDTGNNVVTPCTFVPSTVALGKTLAVNEDGSSVVVEPDGSQTRTVPAGQPNFDSPYTWATVIGEFLVYRSAGGRPRVYRMLV